MSTIKIEFESEDNAVVTAVAALTNSLLGKSTAKAVESVIVVDPEEVKAEATVKTPTPRASRAKVKPEPIPVEGEEEIEDDDLDGEDDAPQTAEINADDIRAVQATKVDKHRETIKAQLKKLGATGIKDLDEAHYAKYYDFLTKLK